MTLYEHCEKPKNGWTKLGVGEYRSKALEDEGVRMNGLSGIKIEGPGDCAALSLNPNYNPNPNRNRSLHVLATVVP